MPKLLIKYHNRSVKNRVADLNLDIGQQVTLHKDSSTEFEAEVIAKDKNNFDVKILNSEGPLILKEDQKWTLVFEGRSRLYQLTVQIKQISNRPKKIIVIAPIGELKMVERRRYQRVKMSAEIEYRSLNNSDTYQAHLVDISASGLKMEVGELNILEMEKKIMIDFSQLDQFPVTELEARILRIKINQTSKNRLRRYYVGLEFVKVSPEKREELIDLVERKKQEQDTE